MNIIPSHLKHELLYVALIRMWLPFVPEQFSKFHSYARSKFRIGHTISLALPVAHALTGCDSNSALSGIGERSMLNILKCDERMADAILNSLGVYPDEVDEEAMRTCIKFVSNLYMGKGTYQSTKVQLK